MSRTERRGLEVPFNWDPQLANLLGAINALPDAVFPIVEAYASDPLSATGSGRPGNSLPVRNQPLGFYIRALQRYGIRFNYLLNGAFLGGAELDAGLWRQVSAVLEELQATGTDAVTVTVANPILAMRIGDAFPDLRISSSVNIHLDSGERVDQLFDYAPYRTIILDHRFSRHFPLLRSLRERYPTAPIVVLANESCLPDCVLQPYHQDFLANTSRIGGVGKEALDVYHIQCARRKLLYPDYCLKARWIRPDDVAHMFEAGVTVVKLAGRTMPTAWIAKVATAYATGRFNEDDLWPLIEKSGLTSPDWNAALGRELAPCRYVVHNRHLAGFIEPFVTGKAPCVRGPLGCVNCGYCRAWTKKAVEYPSNGSERLSELGELLEIAHGRTAPQPALSAV
jgi:collagenase-like PrtC family protease